MIEWIVTSSVLITVVIILRFLFKRKISQRLQYALWGLVLLRLLIPFSIFSSPLSIMNWEETSKSPVMDYVMSDLSLPPDFAPAAPGPDTTEVSRAGTQAEYKREMTETPEAIGKPPTFADVFSVIWLIGGIALGLFFIGTNLVFYGRLRRTRKAFDTDCNLPIYIAEGIASPCLFGILHPVIYLTSNAAESENGIRYVLAHELCHFRHGDHVWSLLRGLCLAVWWWNPLVWMAAVLSRADSELACDEAVIKNVGEDNRFDYGRTLVDMIAVRKSPVGLMHAATTMVSGKSGIKARLNRIIKNPKAFIPAMAAVVLIVAFCVLVTFTGAKVGLDAKIEAGLSDPDPLVRQAWTMIKQDIEQNEYVSSEVFIYQGTTFTDAEITRLELTDSFDDLYEGAVIEVYALQYRMLAEDMSKIMLSGGMTYEGDWLLSQGSMGDPSLVAKKVGDDITYIGTIYPVRLGVRNATLELLEKLETEDSSSLRGEYFDFAVSNRLDYVPFFKEGNAPTDIAEYLFYAFAINFDNWNEEKGTMTRDYVEKVIRDRFEVGNVTNASISINKLWNYDGVKYTAVPAGINDKPIYVLKSIDSAIENNRTVYAVTMDYCVTEEYPLNDEQRQEIRTAVVAGDYSALTVVRTESFRYYVDETTGKPVFLSHSASRTLSDYIKTAVRMNYRHIGWQSYTEDQETIGFVADAIIGALPETLDQTASVIDNESIARDYWEQGSCIELVFDGNNELSYTLLGDIRRSYPCDRMLVCFTKSEDVVFLSTNGVYTHMIGPLDAVALKPVYDWLLGGMEGVGYFEENGAEILGQKITVHRNADLERLPQGYDNRPLESAMSRSLAFYQAAHFRWYELIDRLSTEGLKAEIRKWDNNSASEANDFMQLPRITGVAFPVSVSEPVFLAGDPGRLGVTLGLDENTTVAIELAEGSDGRFLIDSFKITATGRFENWELSTLANLGFGYSVEDFETLSQDQIKSIFAPGALLDGAPAFMPDEAQLAELSAHDITEAHSGILGNLGYSYEEMLTLSPKEFNFIFPNTELWDKLAAKGYDTKTLRRPEALLHAGYDSFKALIREALSI